MCDPPSGWRYGFPKILPKDVKNIEKWLVSEGYPQKEIDSCGQHFHIRCWDKEIEE